MKTKKILTTEIVRIELSSEGYHTFVAMQDGGWLEMATFTPDLKGLVNALDLATNCAAGKFYPKRCQKGSEVIGIEHAQTLIEVKK